MSTPILATKLYVPPPRPKVVVRARLNERLNQGLHSKLTLLSAPAGFGKTTLVSAWAAGCGLPVAWLSLDERDNDPARFLTYFVAALQTVAPNVGTGALRALQSPQPPPMETVLTALLNEITALQDSFILVLDDYHVIETPAVNHALDFLLEHLPPRMHLVITTREDPQLQLARLRARGQLSELRAADLRFTPSEASAFLNQGMGLHLSAADIAALETRTEGWIAGLQLAAISLQGHPDASRFVQSFSGSHHFVMDYLVAEVLRQQPERFQTFLLRTSILERLCGSLCDAVLGDAPGSGQATLEHLERANLFIVPLDNERRWYRYHHLFGDLLRQRLELRSAAPAGSEGMAADELHIRASQWYEEHELELEAFQHATAAHDVERAERLIEGQGMPLHFRGAVTPVLHWLEQLAPAVLDAWPSLWTSYASVLLVTGQWNRVERTLQAAEYAVQAAEPNDKTRDLVGRLAAIRATVAVNENRLEAIISLSNRALEYLAPNNLAFRTSTAWKLGLAYHMQGERVAARRAYSEVISIGRSSGNAIYTLLATIGLGILQEMDNQLGLAAKTYEEVLQTMGAQPLPFAQEAYLGLARVSYEWNELAAAQRHAEQSVRLARQIENNENVVACEVFLARLKLAQGDGAGASAILAAAEQFARQHNFTVRLRDVAAAQVLALLRQNDPATAAQLAQIHEIPLSQARIYLALGDAPAALEVLEPLRRQAEAKGWADERLKIMVLQAVAQHAHGAKDEAVRLVGEALALAEPGGFVRLFVDEGAPMAGLLSEAAARGHGPEYVGKLLAAFGKPLAAQTQPLIEPLSPREMQVLRLIAQGLSNREIGERLFVAVITVKGHNQRIFGKLQVQRRTEAVARARELGLL